ncbi:MAG: GTPase [Actinomycetota bacterium]|jgi:GTP-binding protein|nr:GTPase [Actinomycetota bacterium]
MSSGAARIPVVAVVGRPNVGKSSLVNRVLGRREAIVEETPGVTRDRHAFTAEWRGRSFELVDTGGLEPGARGLDAKVAEQAQIAMDYADVIMLVVDASVGPQADDVTVAGLLRGVDKPVVLVANKVDSGQDEPGIAEFYALGLGEPHPVSALHGRGSGDLLDAVLEVIPDKAGDPDDVWATFAIIGRPNVGKSSLLNGLVGEQRSITDSVPGTTRDPVDSYIDLDDGRRLRILDTAGMRRQVAIKDPLEYFSFIRSRRTLQRVDAVLLVIDTSEGATGLDQRLAEEVIESGRACIIVLNKWDLITKDETDRERLENDIETQLRFLPWATVVRTSALTKRGVDKLLPALLEAVDSHRRRMSTSEVNKVVEDAQLQRPAPRSSGRNNRILYAVQADVAPPRFIFFSSHRLDDTYLRYLEKRIREVDPFAGTPFRMEVRKRKRKVEG